MLLWGSFVREGGWVVGVRELALWYTCTIRRCAGRSSINICWEAYVSLVTMRDL